MCLLALFFRAHPDAPLVVAANRDERLARAAGPVQILRASPPRVLGGRDLVAGLTNRPSPEGRDPSRRSRGELPMLALARTHADARSAATALAATVLCRDYHPGWMLLADRAAAFSVEIGESQRPVVRELGPGLHVLENRPLEAGSAKAAAVRRRLQAAPSWRGAALERELGRLLGSHEPPGPEDAPEHANDEPGRPAATLAACVHAGIYGTRSALIVTVPADAQARPRVLYYADGPACTAPFMDVSGLWCGPES
jgi:uncharacterized protein with NRDE domain